MKDNADWVCTDYNILGKDEGRRKKEEKRREKE
jgi:hypothetical protein